MPAGSRANTGARLRAALTLQLGWCRMLRENSHAEGAQQAAGSKVVSASVPCPDRHDDRDFEAHLDVEGRRIVVARERRDVENGQKVNFDAPDQA
jgi:hypothetical protein